METSNDIILGYWPSRSLSGTLRSLLAYCGINYKEKIYTDANEWFDKDKIEFKTDFPNLPYLKEGSKIVTESNAILQYIPLRAGRKELLGDTDDKFIQVQIALGAVGDLWTGLAGLCWTKGNFAAEKEEQFTKGSIKAQLTHFNNVLKDKEWICGFISVADFKFFEAVELVHDIDASLLEAYPNLSAFYKRFIELPKIKEFRGTSLFKKIWFTPGMATWTNA